MDASTTLDACLMEALRQTREWVPRWLDTLHGMLQQREGEARSLHERQVLLEARTRLESHRALIASRFLEAFAAALEGVRPATAATARKLQSLSFDELELMGDEQVHEAVEQARVQQVIKLAVDEALVGLNARMSRVLGLQRVQPERNPLRSEVVVAALMRAVNGLHIDPAVRSRWLQTGAVTLGSELQAMYERLSALLDSWGVTPVGYAVIQTPASRASVASAVSAPPPPGRATRADAVLADSVRGSDTLLTLDHLHQLLVGNLAPGAAGLDGAMVRTLAADVVTLMLKRMAEDTRLLAPVRDLLQGLKPALLQLARSDPRFFADRHNPARRLLDAITERSLAFTSEQDSGFALFAAQVQGIVRALQEPGADLSQRFAALLEQLVRAQAEAVAPAQTQAQGLAVQTLVRVEQRNLLAERVAAEFRARNDFARSPGVVRRFLTGPWAQVVARARLQAADRSGSAALSSSAAASALRYTNILPDLLWSSQLALASCNRSRLIKVVPGVLRTLREGLDAIDYPREQTEAFFQTLLGLHEAAYKTQRSDFQQEAQPSRQTEPEPEPWMPPLEVRDAGLLEDLPAGTHPSFADTRPMQRNWADIKAEQSREQEHLLAPGAWVDLWQNERPERFQLTWASPHGTMFMFTSADGRSISLTKRGLERALQRGHLRVVAEQGVVDAALDEVAHQAWINSAKS